jgi:WhiB family redox-sensing transcriptional regulator
VTNRFDAELWRLDAACSGVGPDVFFPDHGEPTPESDALCRGCLVRDECLAYALANPELGGIWAGTSGRHRQRMRKRAALSRRPNKEAVGW